MLDGYLWTHRSTQTHICTFFIFTFCVSVIENQTELENADVLNTEILNPFEIT